MPKSHKYLNIALFVLTIAFVLLVIRSVQQAEVPVSSYVYLFLIALTGLTFMAVNMLNPFSKDHQANEHTILEDFVEDAEEETTPEEIDKTNIPEWVDKVLKKTKKESLEVFSESLLRSLTKEFEVVQGLYFSLDKSTTNFKKIADFAYYSEIPPREFAMGETISGQVAKNQKAMKITDIPEGYITVLSGLGSSSPSNLLIVPVLNDGETIGVIELAFFKEPGNKEMQFFEELAVKSGLMAGKFLTEKS
jgi:putative methionine-R-sulfoxide reductase with GAF domain